MPKCQREARIGVRRTNGMRKVRKNKIRMKARRCVGRRLDTRMDYEWESTGEYGGVRESTGE